MLNLTDVSEVSNASIIRAMMEAVRTSEMSVNFNVTTRHYIPEGSKLQVLTYFAIIMIAEALCWLYSQCHIASSVQDCY
jgi:hypothetical protein